MKREYFNNNCSSDGFTLVELLVAVAMFSIIIILLTSLFISATTLQSRAFNQQAVYDDAAVIFEKIVRDVVPSVIVTAGTFGCVDISTTNVLELNSWAVTTTPGSSEHVYFYAQLDANGKKKIERQLGITGQPGTIIQELSSNKVEMTGLKYCVKNPGLANGQGRVTLSATFSSISKSPEVLYKLQTTVTQRLMGKYTPSFVTL